MRWINLFGFMLDGFKVSRHAVDYCFGPMHACSLHTCDHALLHLLLIVIYPRGLVMTMHE
jgi:hypothetical protein